MPNSIQNISLESLGYEKIMIPANLFVNLCIYKQKDTHKENVIISSHGGFVDDKKIIVPDETQFFFYVKDGDMLEDPSIYGLITRKTHLEKNTVGQTIRDYRLSPYQEEDVPKNIAYTNDLKQLTHKTYDYYKGLLEGIYKEEADSLEKNSSISLEQKNFNLTQRFSHSRFIEKMKENNSDILVLEKTFLGILSCGLFSYIKLSEVMKLLKEENYHYKNIHCSFCRADLRLREWTGRSAPQEDFLDIYNQIKKKGSLFIKEKQVKGSLNYEYKKGNNSSKDKEEKKTQGAFKYECYANFSLLNEKFQYLHTKNEVIGLRPEFKLGLKKLIRSMISEIYHAKGEHQKYALANDSLVPAILDLFSKSLAVGCISEENLVDVLIPKITDKELSKNFLLFLLTKPQLSIKENASHLLMDTYNSFSSFSKERQKDLENFINYLYEKEIIDETEMSKFSKIINQNKSLDVAKDIKGKTMPAYASYEELSKYEGPSKLENHSANANAKEMLHGYQVHEEKLHHLEHEVKEQISLLQEHDAHHQEHSNEEHV